MTSSSQVFEAIRRVDSIVDDLPVGERYAVIGSLCARFLLAHNIASGSVDFAEFVAMFGKSVDTVLVEMELQKAAPRMSQMTES
jgi:hypothetical protein